MKRHSLLFALFIFLSSLSMQAEETAGKWSERYNVTAITMDEGLPHNFVDDILKDSQGFLWIATRGEGIARYDLQYGKHPHQTTKQLHKQTV